VITLAIDTATPQVGVALRNDEGPMVAVHITDGRRHGEVLAPAIEAACRMAGVALGDVGLIAADVGPGLFTGLRVGLATAQALASALGVPAFGATSTEVLAAAQADAGRPVAAVVDIRRGEVAWALYEPVAGAMVEVRPPERALPAELGQVLAGLGGSVLAVGDGALRYAAELGKVAIGGVLAGHPSAAVLAELAAARAGEAGRPAVATGALTPRYLRDADVRIGWAQADARG
jgi:tRNA threonylcarbamoyladenosine biosynthesis protein TsaB